MHKALTVIISIILLSLNNTQLCFSSEETIQKANELQMKGDKLFGQGSFGEGLELFRQATQVDPKAAEPHMNYGSMLFGTGANLYKQGNEEEAKP